MKVLYVCRPEDADNCDETAIAASLTALGHEVVMVHEKPQHRKVNPIDVKADWCLFNKWAYEQEIARMKIPCVMWFFDLVASEDSTLRERAASRIKWMEAVVPHCLLACLTDGDFVARASFQSSLKDRDARKLVHLPQGMDERVAGFGTPGFPGLGKDGRCDILFTGMVNHGQRRAEHIAHLRKRWGDRFVVWGDGGPKRRVHGKELANLFASAKVVVAPDGPGTDRYWSNRVVLTCGLGGFLLHPFSAELTRHYRPDVHLRYYHSRAELDEHIEFYLSHDTEREAMRQAGHARTLSHNLYRHRVAELVAMVEERL